MGLSPALDENLSCEKAIYIYKLALKGKVGGFTQVLAPSLKVHSIIIKTVCIKRVIKIMTI